MLTILATVVVSVYGQNQMNMNMNGGKISAGMNGSKNYAQFKRGQNKISANMNGNNNTVNMNMMGNSMQG